MSLLEFIQCQLWLARLLMRSVYLVKGNCIYVSILDINVKIEEEFDLHVCMRLPSRKYQQSHHKWSFWTDLLAYNNNIGASTHRISRPQGKRALHLQARAQNSRYQLLASEFLSFSPPLVQDRLLPTCNELFDLWSQTEFHTIYQICKVVDLLLCLHRDLRGAGLGM